MRHKNLVIFITLALLSACKEPSVYEEKKDLSNSVWHVNDNLVYEFEIDEPQLTHSFLVNFRVHSDYPYQNLYVAYSLEDSSNNVIKSAMRNHLLFDPKTGEPMGTGAGSMYNITDTLLNNVNFRHEGTYSVTLTQYMRTDSLPQINAVGLKVIN